MDQLNRIAQTKTRLIECMPFFGRLLLCLKPRLAVFGDFVSTMAVAPDGTLVVNKTFCEGLEDGELAACLVHEVMHPALLYWERLGTKLPILFNEAQDYCINLIIRDFQSMNIYLPEFLLINKDYEGMSAEEIYEILFRKRKSNKEKKRALFYDCRGDLSAGPAIEWREELADAVRFHEQRKGRGSITGNLSRIIAEQLNEAQVNWIENIRRFLGEFGRRSTYTYSRPSARSESAGEYLPSLQSSLPQVAVFLDTSGSISKELLTQAVSEISGICLDLNIDVRVIVIDAAIHFDDSISDISSLKIKGGGGSDFRPAFERLEKECFSDVVIAITDGDIAVPRIKPDCIRAVLWLVKPENNPPTESWGEVVRF